MKVLLVDDSKTMRNIQRGILTQLGYEQIEEAVDGEDALVKVKAFGPELILLDWNMPNMDGITFIREYRGSGAKIPVIMVTTEAEKSRVVEAIKAGVNNYVVKPFTPNVLGERIQETLSRMAA
ncbi:MAG: response regulator [Planctomycetota bacterium]